MARPKVPHCKECEYCTNINEKWKKYHFLKYAKWYCEKRKEYIDGQEIRTSPTWCPERNTFRN